MTDPQNAHNPDKTQPLNAMPAADAVPSSAPAPDKTSTASKAPAAQMELLNPLPPATPAAEKHNPDKTQPLHVIPPTSLAPHESAKPSSPPPEVTPPPPVEPAKTVPAHQETTKISAPSAATPMWPIEAPKTQPANTTAHHEATQTSAPNAATLPRSEATTPSASIASVHPETARSSAPPVSTPPRIDTTKTAAASTTLAHQDTVKASPPTAVKPPPRRIETAKAAQAAATQSHQAITKAATSPIGAPTSSSSSPPPHSEPAKTPPAPVQGEYIKTVTMAAASPDVVLSRSTKPLTSVRDRLSWISHKIATTAFVTEILPGAGAKLRAYGALTRLNKPIGIWLLMWPVLWALWISSGGRPDPHVFIVFVLGTVLTRSAGCAINDFADRNFDGHVKRTKDRPLVTGAVDPMEAIAICLGLGLIALGLALTLNLLAQKLTLIGGVLVLTYPFFKRFFPLPQAYLGIAFTWSVPMAFAAQSGEVSRIAVVMFLAGVAWTVAYDTMYAMVDREDDKKLGIRSSAILFGDADRFIIGIMQLMTLLGLWLIGHEMELGLWYGLGLTFAAMFALYQQLLIRERKPEQCFRAFLNNNYFGMSVFIGILLEYTFR